MWRPKLAGTVDRFDSDRIAGAASDPDSPDLRRTLIRSRAPTEGSRHCQELTSLNGGADAFGDALGIGHIGAFEYGRERHR